MSPEAQRIAIAEACGWRFENYGTREFPNLYWRVFNPDGKLIEKDFTGADFRAVYVPDYLNDRNAMLSALRHHGIHDPANLDIRVKYSNTLREIVGRRMPKNKSGSPLTSDVDLLMAENEEIVEALLRTIKKWKP